MYATINIVADSPCEAEDLIRQSDGCINERDYDFAETEAECLDDHNIEDMDDNDEVYDQNIEKAFVCDIINR